MKTMKYLAIIIFLCGCGRGQAGVLSPFDPSDHGQCRVYGSLRYPEKMQDDIIELVCRFLEETKGVKDAREYVHHSDYRPKSALDSEPLFISSQHNHGKALDFRLTWYGGMSRRFKLENYLYDYYSLVFWLQMVGHWDYVGFGIYPDSLNPFFHLDTRGSKARWSRLKGKYLSIDQGYQWILSELSSEI